MEEEYHFYTGIPSLDLVLRGVLPGDNVVWQVDTIDDYVPFVHAFCRKALKDKKQLVYFRFAQHQYLLPDEIDAEVHTISPNKGFELFLTEIFNIIEEKGLGACYVFDCLSDLAVDWFSDVMLANFFMLTCPYLYRLNTATYFALLRNHNAQHATKDIHETAQVVLDLYKYDDCLYMHPLKVEGRHSPTIYMLHKWLCDGPFDEQKCIESHFEPVKDSVTTSEILSRVQQPWLDYTVKRLDVWSMTFRKAKNILDKYKKGQTSHEKCEEYKRKLIRMAIARMNDERFKLADKYLTLNDLLSIGKRMIGSGLIGGKSVGMLLGRAILERDSDKWLDILEKHDSFFIGSDVFYTYLVKNELWWDRRRLSSKAHFLEGISEVEDEMMKGTFSRYTIRQFEEILDYFGQSPIIIRSSSIQEDALGNAFSGKYESVYLANQGDPDERLEAFCKAVRKVYSSALNKEALMYRKDRGLLDKDEQMALLIQRVSGGMFSSYYYPHIAGVGFSFNPFVWDRSIDPKAGFLRIVAGLGTRAVDRTADDYTRLIPLNNPQLRPHSRKETQRQFSQKKLDIIDLEKNCKISYRFSEIVKKNDILPLDLISTKDYQLEYELKQRGRTGYFTRFLDFQGLIEDTDIIDTFREMLDTLEHAYQNPVDIEFTINYIAPQKYKINLLQCRTFQVRMEQPNIDSPGEIDEDHKVFESNGPIIGKSIATKIDYLIYVVPQKYGKLPNQKRYKMARLIGKITKKLSNDALSDKKVMMMGPGRWGTSTPSLGIPVSFSEFNTVQIIGEIAEMHEGLIPDVSLGSHFFNDLVEIDMLYFALHPSREGNFFKREIFEKLPNSLREVIDVGKEWEKIIKLIKFDKKTTDFSLFINMNALEQFGICFFK